MPILYLIEVGVIVWVDRVGQVFYYVLELRKA